MAKKKSDAVSSLRDSVKNQLADLKRRERKLELIIQITEYVSSLTDNPEEPYPEAAEEVAQIFAAFATKVTAKVEGGAELPSASKRPTIVETPAAPRTQPPAVVPPQSSVHDVMAEKIKFMQANKHLENAKVIGTTDSGIEVEGVVRGLDAPYLIVIGTNGEKYRVLPNKVQAA